MELISLAALVLLAYMFIAFVVALIKKDNGIADIAYGGGFILLAAVTYVLGEQTLPALLVSLLVLIWGVRLSYRILKRNWGRPEDFRYAAWREQWGRWFIVRSLFQVFILQGIVIYVVSTPVLLTTLFSVSELSLLSFAALGLWVLGFLFENVGDAQLDAFLKKPENKGRIMDQGLWKYTRHPNYFGESLMWWSIALLAYSVLPNSLQLIGFISPLLITFLLLKVSGVPMLEKRMAGNPAWEAYAAKTSVFIPLPPKR